MKSCWYEMMRPKLPYRRNCSSIFWSKNHCYYLYCFHKHNAYKTLTLAIKHLKALLLHKLFISNLDSKRTIHFHYKNCRPLQCLLPIVNTKETNYQMSFNSRLECGRNREVIFIAAQQQLRLYV